MNELFKGVVDSDPTPIVICNAENVIVYMNPAAVQRYDRRGGSMLVGRSIFDCHNDGSVKKILEIITWFNKSTYNNRVFIDHNDRQNTDSYMIAIRDENGKLIGYYERHEHSKKYNTPSAEK